MTDLIDRNPDDDNFAHTLQLLGPCAAWAECVKPGHRLSEDDLNLIQIPIELAFAFARSRVGEQSPIGEAAAKAVELLETLRGIKAKRSGRGKNVE